MFIIETLPGIFYHNILRSDLPKPFSIAISIKPVAKGKGTRLQMDNCSGLCWSQLCALHTQIHAYIHAYTIHTYIHKYKNMHSYMHSHTSIIQKNTSDKDTLMSQTHLSSRTFTPLQLNPPATNKIQTYSTNQPYKVPLSIR